MDPRGAACQRCVGKMQPRPLFTSQLPGYNAAQRNASGSGVAPVPCLFAILLQVWSVWCIIVAFVGGNLPIVGIQMEGGILHGLLFLFIGEPLLVVLSWLIYLLVGIVLVAIFNPPKRS
jgi:hypothetical protein